MRVSRLGRNLRRDDGVGRSQGREVVYAIKVIVVALEV